MPTLPAFFLLLLLLAGFVPPAAAQSTPKVSLQPSGMLTMMEHAVPTEVYFDGRENDGLEGAGDIAVSGDGALLFVMGQLDDALSVWRVNAGAATLSQTALYQDSEVNQMDMQYIAIVNGRFGGLNGARSAAVSGDGTLLFVTAHFGNTLSVWRINAEAGTLTQNRVYQGGIRETNGLFGVADIVVSNGLLFVTAESDNTLGVWRVNAEAGTLSQTALYQDSDVDEMDFDYISEVDGRFGGLIGVQGATVSGDGALLFVTSPAADALSVWRVNAEAGTLSQTALYQGNRVRENRRIAEVDGRVDGLRGANDLAVSGDGALLFVTGRLNNALSVWRVNAEAGTLSQTALYQDSELDETDFSYIREVDGRFDGLNGARSVAVSGDGALLFVTGQFSDALSVWRVNAEAGTLSQTAVYQDKDTSGGNFIDNVDGRVDGLDWAWGVAVSGDLLFVTADQDNALSVWQINNAEVPFGVPVMISVQSDMPVVQEAKVTVTAQSGANMVEATATLSPSTPSADAIFPPGFLRPGRWIFTAQASPPTALDTSAARIAMQVLPPLLSLEPQQDRFALGSTVVLTVRTIAGLPEPASFEIDAVNTASGETTATITVEYSAGTTEQEVLFPAEAIAMFGLGRLDFSIRLPDNSPFQVSDSSTATVQILTPQQIVPRLRLVPLPELLALGSTVALTVRADQATPTEAIYNIIARNLTSASTVPIPIEVIHPAGVTVQEVSFPAQQIASPGQWEFSIQLPEDSPFQVGDGSAATVQIVIPRLQLVPLPELLALGSTVSLTVQAKVGVPTEATYSIIARRLTSASTVPIPIEVIHPAGVTAQEVFFSAQQIASPGQWEFSIRLPEGFPFQVIANGTATVYVAPVLSLRLQGEAFSEGDSLTIEVRTDSPPAVAAAVTITAQRQQDGVEVNAAEAVTLSPAPAVSSGQAEFSAGALGAGIWVFTAQSEPPQALYTADARAEAAVLPPPLRLEVSAPREAVAAGSMFSVTVNTDAPVPAGTEVSVMVTFEGAAQTEILSAGETAATVTLTAPGTAGTFTVNATGMARATETGALAPTVNPSGTSVEVVPVPVMLTLFPASPLRVVANAQFSVEVGTNRPLPAGTEVNVQLQFNGASRPAVVSSTMPAPSVMFTAPPSGTLPLIASVVDITQSSPVVAVSAPASVAVQVTALLTIMLTASAPPSVTVGNTFTVTVGVAEEPPLPAGVSVTATVSSRAADGEEIRAETTVLSTMMPSDTLSLSAPVTAGTFSVTVSGQSEGTDDLLVMATGASASVTAVPVAVMLRLNGPAAVSVGQRYTVMVDTVMPVPKGTTLEVTVSSGTEPQEAFLTADNPSEELPFTAPLVASEVMLTAMTVMVQTAVDTLEVAVPDAVTLTVSVSALDVQLALSELPVDLVAASSNFPVMVGTEPALPEGAKVMVTVSLAAFSSEPMLLTSSTPMASVIVTAPTTGGAVTLRATGEAANDSTLNVLAATATVQVQAEDTVTLTLNAPRSVTVGSTFPVTVGVSATTPLAEGISVTATVSFGVPNGEELQAETAVVTAAIPSDMRVFRAPVTADFYSVIVRGQVEETDDLRVRVNITSIRVIVVPVAVMLQLSAPGVVTVGQDYRVTVDTVMPVPEGTTLEVTVRAGTEPQEALFLTAGNPSEDIPFMAPRVASEVMFTAMTVMVQTAADALEVAVPDTVTLTVRVSAREVQLALSEVPVDLVPAASTFSVTVSAAPEMLAGTTVRVTVRLAAFASEPVLLTPGAPTASVLVMAPANDGDDSEETLLATGEAAADSTLELNVLPAQATVRVRAADTVELTLNAPENVTVGSTFPVTVGVAEETPLPEGVSVTATVSFHAADGEEIQAETAVLSTMMPSDTRVFRAPVTAGVYTVAVSGQVDETAALRVTVIGASVTVAPVAVMLQLSGPQEAVTVGQTYTVTVDTNMPVPTGTMLEVTVRAGTATALQEEVSLTETISRLSVSFTAPARAGPVTVTATATVQTAMGALEVAVPDTATLAVTVSAQDVQLMLSGVPDLVAAGSTFPVTVGTAMGLPEGAAVMVTVSLAALSSEPMTLTPSAPTARVIVTAPPAGGAATLSATGEEAADSRLELNVLAAEAVQVQVQVQVSLSLRLEAPPEVTARDSFAVTVSTEPEVPGGATVTVTVAFDGTDSSPVVLSAEMASTAVMFTAPSRIENDLELMTSSVVKVADANVLQVVVTEASATVNAAAQSVQLTLVAMPERVAAGQEVAVTAGVSPALLADTTLTVKVFFGEASSQQVTLSDKVSSQEVSFPTSATGTLEVSAQTVEVEPADLVVAAAAQTQTVEVLAEGTVELTLDALKSVTVGSTFPVTVGVGAGTPLPAGTAVTATLSFNAADSEDIEVMLIPGAPSTAVVLTAPRRSGIFVVVASGAEDSLAIRFVVDTSAQVSVEPVRVTLTLSPPDAVTVGETYQVMVGTNMAVPEGTMLKVTVSDGTVSREVSLAADNSEEVSFTAPANVRQVTVTATATVQTDADALEVAVSDAEPLTVSVSARDVQLVLSAFPRLVAAGSPFPVTVGATPEVPEGTTVMVTVSLGNSSAPATLTPRAATERVLVTAPTADGTAILRAAGEEAAEGALELNVLPAETTVQVQVQVLQLGLQRDQPLTAGSPVTLTVRAEIEPHTAINYTAMALHTVSEMTSSMLTIHPAGTTTHSVSFSGQQIASPGPWEFSILPAELPFESMPITVTISLDFIQPQGIINADDLLFALRYLVRCGGSAAGCQANGEDLDGLARNLGNALQIEQLPAALQLPNLSGGGEERPAANWFILLLGLQGLPVELLFPASEEPSQLENDIRSMLSVQEQEE